MSEKPIFIKFRAFFLFGITAIAFLFYANIIPDDGIVSIQTVNKIKVLFVKENSDAYKKGVKPGFTIVGVNHKLIIGIDEIAALITFPKTDFLFENNNGELVEITLKEKKVRRIIQPEIVFIFISLLLYILSISLILNNREIKELYFLHTAIFITHLATLVFVVKPSYSSFETSLMLMVMFSFPGLPYVFCGFLTGEIVLRKKGFRIILPLMLIMGYLFLVHNMILLPLVIYTLIFSGGYFYLAYTFKSQKSSMYFPRWFFYLSLYFGVFSLLIVVFLIKGVFIFTLAKFLVLQQILFNSLILYNILKYGVYNQKLALKKSFVDAFIFLVLLILYTFLIYFINKVLGRDFIAGNLKVYSVMLGILIVFILNPINEWLKDRLEFLLFKQERKLIARVFEMTDKMINLTDGEEVEEYLRDIVDDFLKLDVEVLVQVGKNLFKKLNSHKMFEVDVSRLKVNKIEKTPLFSFSNLGYNFVYQFLQGEDKTVLLISKEPLTVQEKQVLEHIFVQFSLTYQNIKLIEKAQKQIELERDMKIAGLIQRSLIPSFHPEGENFEIYGISESARTVGGDFFDYLPSEDGRLKVIIGDVAGKSVPAAIMMVSAKETLFARSANIESPSELMRESNRLLYLRSNKNMFVACIYFVFDPKKLTLNYINAGMPSPFLIREDSITILKKQKVRFPLGLLPDVDYREEEIKLKPGDVLIFLTDGVSESLGEDIVGILEECAYYGSSIEIARCILQTVKDKTLNILEDDATIVVLKIKG